MPEIKIFIKVFVFSLSIFILLCGFTSAQMLRDHEVVLDNQGRLLPWTTYDNVIKWSMNFINQCPTKNTKFGDDPWYLISSVFNPDGSFKPNQNNQGGNAFWAVETVTKYYAYSADWKAVYSVRLLLDRVLLFHTPADWAWQNVPRTQDDTPDGEYTDERSEPDKVCMAGLAYLKFYKIIGEKKYLDAALGIAKTVVQHIQEGDELHSPLPFRVNFKTGEVVDNYSANMIYTVILFDEIEKFLPEGEKGMYKTKRDIVRRWILKYPMINNKWSGYYEDVRTNIKNMNQQCPMETARYILQHPEIDPDYKQHIPALLHYVEERFGKVKQYGATSIKEQDSCFVEMSSHTARYASIAAKWFGVTMGPKDREEARASFAVATYSAYNKYSKDGKGINYVGIGFTTPWFSDSYFDYLAHIFDGMAELPELAPDNANHIIGSNSVITRVKYSPSQIEYWTYEPDGDEILRLTFNPVVMLDGKPLSESQWTSGEYRGVPGILRIHRTGAKYIMIQKK